MCAGDIRGIQAWAAAGCRDILPHPSSPPRLPDAHLHFPRAQIAGLTHEFNIACSSNRCARLLVSDGLDEQGQ